MLQALNGRSIFEAIGPDWPFWEEEARLTRHPRERRDPRAGLSRRDFLKRTGGAALAAPSLAAILAACTKPGTTAPGGSSSSGKSGPGTGKFWPADSPYPLARQDAPVTWNLWQDPIASGQPIETGATLQIYNWSDYINPAVLKKFAAQYDCKVKVTTFNNTDEALAKMRTGQLQFDVFFPTIDILGKLITTKLIQPLQHSYVPHLASDVFENFQNPFYDQGWRYTVPYTTYTTGIAYRRDLISDDSVRAMSNPWDLLWDPTYKGKVGVYDEYRESISLALMKNGITDLNTTKQSDLDTAQNDLIAMIDAVNVRSEINGVYIGIPKGNFDVHLSWSGDAVGAYNYWPAATMANYEKIGFWYPSNRVGAINNDLITIPSTAEHPVLAHTFLDYIQTYEIAMLNFSWNGYQPPQKQADISTLTTTNNAYGVPYVFPWMQDAVITADDFATGKLELELTPATDALWHNVWQSFNAGVK
jgi:spermidine/putrescine transport system substrate-binding protein